MPAFRPVPPSFSAARAAAAARPRMVPNARPTRAVIPQAPPQILNPNKTVPSTKPSLEMPTKTGGNLMSKLPPGMMTPKPVVQPGKNAMAPNQPGPALDIPRPGSMPSQGIGNTNMAQKGPSEMAAEAYKTYKAGETRNGVTAPTMPSPGMSSPNIAPKPTALSPGGPSAFPALGMKRGGAVKAKQPTKFSSGGSVSSASKRGDGIAQRGKTRGKMC